MAPAAARRAAEAHCHPPCRGAKLPQRIADAQRADGEAVALAEDLADAAAVADAPIGLVADEAGRRRLGDPGERLERVLGLGGGELGVDNAPEAIPLPTLVRRAALGRRAERPEMKIAHAGALDAGAKLPFREAGAARQRQIAHIDDGSDPGVAERRQELGEIGLLVADEIKRLAAHRCSPGGRIAAQIALTSGFMWKLSGGMMATPAPSASIALSN